MQSDENAIRQTVATWMSATQAGDLQTVLGLMTDDAIFLVAGRPPMLGKAAYAAASRPKPGQAAPKFEGSSEIQEIKVLGDWAFMRSKLTVVVTPPGGGEQMTRAGHTLTIFNKCNGQWLLARDANMLVAV